MLIVKAVIMPIVTLSLTLFYIITNGNFTIMNGAFQNLVNSTFWVNIPSNCTEIGSNAFYNANFNYNRFLGNKIKFVNKCGVNAPRVRGHIAAAQNA